MVWLKVALGAGKLAGKALKAYKKKKTKLIKKGEAAKEKSRMNLNQQSKEWIDKAKKGGINEYVDLQFKRMSGTEKLMNLKKKSSLAIGAGAAVKQTVTKNIKSLKAKLKNIWSNPN